jgi:hypothetical protein
MIQSFNHFAFYPFVDVTTIKHQTLTLLPSALVSTYTKNIFCTTFFFIAIYFYTFATALVSNPRRRVWNKRECRENRQQFPLL